MRQGIEQNDGTMAAPDDRAAIAHRALAECCAVNTVFRLSSGTSTLRHGAYIFVVTENGRFGQFFHE
jgi:hypothetical protein